MNLKAHFELAAKESKGLKSKQDNETFLKLYSLYKLATEGDISPDTPAPGMFDFVNKAKYDAWQKCKGMSSEACMEEYIKTVDQLKGA